MKTIYTQRMIKRRIKNQKGFTLLELILAMSIVAIVVALGLGGVRLGIAARDVGEQKVDIYQLRSFFIILFDNTNQYFLSIENKFKF